MGIQNKKGEP